MSADLHVVVLGRIGIDLYADQPGVPLKDVTSFSRYLGGSATNVAAAAARLGLHSALITKVGDDAFGVFAREECARLGVDTRWMSVHPALATPLAFAELHPPDHFPLVYYRSPAAPDDLLKRDDVDLEVAAHAPVVWTTGGALANPSSRGVTLELLERATGRYVVHDLDLRSALWPSMSEAAECNRQAVRQATVVVGNRSEAELATGRSDPYDAAADLLSLGPRLAIVKCGPEGALFATPEEVHFEAAMDVVVVNGLGAGDAFGGALCWSLLEGRSLRDTALLCNAAGALVAGRKACAEAMPTLSQLLALAGLPR